MNEFYLSPSQAYDRIEELRRKMEFDTLTPEEQEELDELRNVLMETSPDYLTNFQSY